MGLLPLKEFFITLDTGAGPNFILQSKLHANVESWIVPTALPEIFYEIRTPLKMLGMFKLSVRLENVLIEV